MRAAVNRRAVVVGLLCAAVAGGVLSGLVPGSSGWAAGPRIGVGTLLLTLGLVFLVGAFAGAIRARTARVEGAGGGCPVGATCACGHFNFKPRKACRQCGAATTYAA